MRRRTGFSLRCQQIGYDAVMWTFSLKRLLACVMLIGSGIGLPLSFWMNNENAEEFLLHNVPLFAAIALFLLPGTMLGAGLCMLFTKRKSTVVFFAAAFAILGAFIQGCVYMAQLHAKYGDF
jgi:hypothetical protein